MYVIYKLLLITSISYSMTQCYILRHRGIFDQIDGGEFQTKMNYRTINYIPYE